MAVYPAKIFDPQDPEAVLDYAVDWELWLDGDTIDTSIWEVTSGITVTASSNTTTKATVWISGGTVGSNYYLTNRITTAGGRHNDRTIQVPVDER